MFGLTSLVSSRCWGSNLQVSHANHSATEISLSMYACLYACMYVCMYVCVFMNARAHTYTYTKYVVLRPWWHFMLICPLKIFWNTLFNDPHITFLFKVITTSKVWLWENGHMAHYRVSISDWLGARRTLPQATRRPCNRHTDTHTDTYWRIMPCAALSIRLTRLKSRGPPRAGVHATF